MLVMNKFMFFNLIFIICTSFYSCKPNRDKIQEVQQYLNLIIYVDLSHDRLGTLLQQEAKDKAIFNEVLSVFEDRQRSRRFISKDRILLVGASFENTSVTTLNMEDLALSNNGGYYGFSAMKDTLITKFNNFYSSKSNKSQPDIWKFFRDDLTRFLKNRGDNTFKNKIIILTDGLIEDSAVGSNTYIENAFSKNVVLGISSTRNWRNSRYLIKQELEPIENVNFFDLQVLLLEIDDVNSTGSVNYFKVIEYLWETWFTRMGIESTIYPSSSTVEGYKEIIKNFSLSTNIKSRIDVPIIYRGENYQLNELNYSEYIEGSKGSYWMIDIRTPEARSLINFNSGQYTIPGYEDEFSKATIEFREKVLDVLKSSAYDMDNFRLYVKGNADFTGNESFKKRVNSPIEICYLPKKNKAENLYLPDKKCKLIKDYVYNSQLPDLRAKFLKEKFEDYYQFDEVLGEVVILEGSVSREFSSSDRNVELILFLSDKVVKE